jgi:S-DNA-T family DNA segregation ATPase FtsK/SpoIIIE
MLMATFLLLSYGVFATIFHDTQLVGSFTMAVGEANIAIFGYMAYVDMFLVAYLVHIFIKYRAKRDIDTIFIGWILMFLSLVMAQALIFDFQHIGIVSSILYLVIKSYIGKIGYSLFTLFSLLLAISILKKENQFKELYEEILSIDSVAEKNLQSFSKTIKDKLSYDDTLEIDSYTPPKPKSKLEREREKLRKYASLDSNKQVA